MLKSFSSILGRSSVNGIDPLTALNEKASVASAMVEELTGKLSAAQASIGALTQERDGAKASLTEALGKVTASETALTECQSQLKASQEAFTALEKEVPEKAKQIAIDTVAGSGIPFGKTPSEGQGSTDLKGALAAATSPMEAAAARLAAFHAPIP